MYKYIYSEFDNLMFKDLLLKKDIQAAIENQNEMATHRAYLSLKSSLKYRQWLYEQFYVLNHSPANEPYYVEKDGDKELFYGCTVKEFTDEGNIVAMIDKTFRKACDYFFRKLDTYGYGFKITLGHSFLTPRFLVFSKQHRYGKGVDFTYDLTGADAVNIFNEIIRYMPYYVKIYRVSNYFHMSLAKRLSDAYYSRIYGELPILSCKEL